MEIVEKILAMCEQWLVLSILESKNNYIVTMCRSVDDIDHATETLMAIDKKTLKCADFSYFNSPEEYAEACDNVLYRYDSELQHHGIKGMRWGIRRYQNSDGSLTAAGKKRYDDELDTIKAKTKALKEKQAIREDNAKRKAELKAAKEELAALKRGKKPEEEKKTKEERAAEDDAAKKERLLMAPDAKEVLANRHLFNEREIQTIRIRLYEEKMIKDLQPQEVDKGKTFVNKTCDNFDKVARLTESGSKAWNGVAKIYNSLYGKKNGLEVPLISDKTSSKLDKFKEETEWKKAQKERRDAEKALNEKKTEQELYKEETTRLQNILARETVEDKLAKLRVGTTKKQTETEVAPKKETDETNKATDNADDNTKSSIKVKVRTKSADGDASEETTSSTSVQKVKVKTKADKMLEDIDNKGWDLYESMSKPKQAQKVKVKTKADKMLEDMDNKGWKIYESMSKPKQAQKVKVKTKVDKMLEDMDNKGWKIYESKNRATSSKIVSLHRQGKTYAEIAEELGVSTSTVSDILS